MAAGANFTQNRPFVTIRTSGHWSCDNPLTAAGASLGTQNISQHRWMQQHGGDGIKSNKTAKWEETKTEWGKPRVQVELRQEIAKRAEK